MNPLIILVFLGGAALFLRQRPPPAGAVSPPAASPAGCTDLGTYTEAESGTIWQFAWCAGVLWGVTNSHWQVLLAPVDISEASRQVAALQ